MFGKEKKPKSKARKIVDWVVTGIFATLLVGVGVIQIINKTNKGQFVLGPQFQRVLTDSMAPVYKINDIIVVEKTTAEDLFKRVNEKKQQVDLSFKWNVNGQEVSMTHRLITVSYSAEPQNDPITGETYQYTFVAHGINTRSEFCKIGDEYGDCTYQTQEFHEASIIGRVTRKSYVMTFATSIWGLLVLLLIPCMYLIISSGIDIYKALKDADEEEKAAAEGKVVGEVSEPSSESSNKDPLAGLSEKEKEKLKKQMLDEMLGKKK